MLKETIFLLACTCTFHKFPYLVESFLAIDSNFLQLLRLPLDYLKIAINSMGNSGAVYKLVLMILLSLWPLFVEIRMVKNQQQAIFQALK